MEASATDSWRVSISTLTTQRPPFECTISDFLPISYGPPDLPTPKGKMVVVTVRAQKQSSTKALVWVKFLSPPSHVGTQIQLYPKSLEPKNGPYKRSAEHTKVRRPAPRGPVMPWLTEARRPVHQGPVMYVIDKN